MNIADLKKNFDVEHAVKNELADALDRFFIIIQKFESSNLKIPTEMVEIIVERIVANSENIPARLIAKSKTELVKEFLDSQNTTDWFSNRDVMSFINENYPYLNINSTTVSSILSMLESQGLLIIQLNQSRRIGNLYKKKTV